MKPKNISFIELHIEKIVAGVLGLFCLYLLVSYASPDYRVGWGGGREMLTPLEVEDRLKDLAGKLEGQVRSDELTIPELNVPSYTQQFRQRWDRKTYGTQFAMHLGYPGLSRDWLNVDVDPEEMQFDVPEIPAPRGLVARQGYAVLREVDEREAMQAYQRLIGSERPLDFRYVTVGGVFDWEEYRKRVQEGGQADPIPDKWWQERQFLSFVRLQRRSKSDAESSWSSWQDVPLLPGSLHYFEAKQGMNWTEPEAKRALDTLATGQRLVARPEFPLTSGGPLWLPPDATVEQLTREQAEELQSINAQIRELEAEMKESRAEKDDNAERQGMRGAGRDTRRGAGVAGRTVGETTEEQLEELRQRRDELLGVRDAGGERPGGVRPGADEMPSPEEKKLVKIWAHDVTVEPDTIYQYRFQVGVVNPLFRKPLLEGKQRETDYHRLSLVSDPEACEPTDPIVVGPNLHFWLKSASEPDEATVEIARLFNGDWQWREFTVRPGDLIGDTVSLSVGGQPRLVDFRVDKVVVDVTFNELLERQQNAQLLLMDRGSGRLSSRQLGDKEATRQREMLRNQGQLVSPGAVSSARRLGASVN